MRSSCTWASLEEELGSNNEGAARSSGHRQQRRAMWEEAEVGHHEQEVGEAPWRGGDDAAAGPAWSKELRGAVALGDKAPGVGDVLQRRWGASVAAAVGSSGGKDLAAKDGRLEGDGVPGGVRGDR